MVKQDTAHADTRAARGAITPPASLLADAVTPPKKRVTLERWLAAPVAAVWERWTTKAGLESWWGPEGFEVAVHKLELREGGELRYAMAAVAKEQIEFMKRAGMPLTTGARVRYLRVEPMRHLRYAHAVDFVPGVSTYEVATNLELIPDGRGVRLVLALDAMHDDEWTERMRMGWESELGKLERVLAASAAPDLAARQISISRVVAAPREVVFRAITEPEHVRHWWGPFGFTNTIHEMSVQPGGTWRFNMLGPDGTDYPNLIRFREVKAPERLSFLLGSGVAGEPDFDVEITLTPEAQGTRVTLRQTHESAERAAEIAKYAVEGGEQTMTRLQGYLAAMRERTSAEVLEGVAAGTDADDFVVLRAFDAPREVVFAALTDPAHLAKWFGPAGMGLRVISSELRPGGWMRYAMKPGPTEMYGRFVYRLVLAPERLAYVVSFTDEQGEPIRHPASNSWPLEVLAIATLTEHGGKTLLCSRSMPIHASDEERRTFVGGHAGMVKGFQGTYDQLDAHLAAPR